MNNLNFNYSCGDFFPFRGLNRPDTSGYESSFQEGEKAKGQTSLSLPSTEHELQQLSSLIQQLCTANTSEAKKRLLAERGLAANIPKDLQYPVNLRLLAMFFGDKVISSSSLEGNSVNNNLDFMIHLLSSSSFSCSFDKAPLLEDFRQLQRVDDELDAIETEGQFFAYIEQLKSELSSLQRGQHFLFPGGWSGKPGHFILYEILATDEGFELNLYNTGAGTSYHSEKVLNQKVCINPVFSVCRIPKMRLCSEYVLQYMVALRTKTYSGVDELNEQDVYQGFLLLLGGEFHSGEKGCWMLEQQAGTCSLKALTAYLKSKMGMHAEECLYSFQFWCLANFLHSKTYPNNLAEKRLIEKAVHGLANRARKVYASRLAALQHNKKQIEEQELSRLLEVFILCEKGLKIAQACGPNTLAEAIIPSSHSSFPPNIFSQLDDIVHARKPITLTLQNQVDSASSESIQDDKEKKERAICTLLLWKAPLLDPANPLIFFQTCLNYSREMSKLSLKKSMAFSIAFERLEQELLALPSLARFGLRHVDSKDKHELFTCLYELAKNYIHLSIQCHHETRIIACLNMWHLFFLLGQLIEEELDMQQHGFDFRLTESLELDENSSKLGIKKLALHLKAQDLIQYAKGLNANKTGKHFDSIITDDLQVTDSSYEDFADFRFIKQKLLHHKNSLPSQRTENHLSPLEEILLHYVNRPKEHPVLSLQYYQLREIYVGSSCFNEVYGPQSLVFEISFKKQNGSYTIEYRLQDSGSIYIGFCCSLVNKIFRYFPVLNRSHTQNQARSLVKRQLYHPKETHKFKVEYDKELSSISTYELHRISDIQGAGSNKFFLGLNFYRENPHYLEKSIHRQLLSGLFYEIFSVIEVLSCYPLIKEDLYVFFTTGLAFYKSPDSKQYEPLALLYELGLDIGLFIQDLRLIQALKENVISHYEFLSQQAHLMLSTTEEKESASCPFLSKFGYLVLSILANCPSLSDQDIILGLSIQAVHQRQWKMHSHDFDDFEKFRSQALSLKNILPFFYQLEACLNDPIRRNGILNSVQPLTENLTFKQQKWSKDLFVVSCSECSFDLLSGQLFLFFDRSLKKAKSLFSGNLEEVVGSNLSDFVFKEDCWVNPEGTIKIILSDRKTDLQRQLDGKWYCYKESKQLEDLVGSYASLHWYQPLDSRDCLVGLDQKGHVLFRCSKEGNKWSIINAKGYHLLDSKDIQLPPYLFPLLSGTRSVNKIWMNAETEQIAQIDNVYPLSVSICQKQENQWVLEGYEDYVIAAHPFLSPFHSLPPYFHLVNREGRHFALIPALPLIVKDKGHPFDPFYVAHVYSSDRIRDKEKNCFYLYEHDTLSGELIAKDLASRLYLAYLYFADQQYSLAHDLLKRSQQTYPYGEEELVVFQQFFDYQRINQHFICNPEQMACLTIISCWLIEKDQLVNLVDIETILYPIKQYIRLMNAIPFALRLSKQEEVLLLNGALLKSAHLFNYDLRSIEQRYHFLTGKDFAIEPFRKRAPFPVNCRLDFKRQIQDDFQNFNYKIFLRQMSLVRWDCLRNNNQQYTVHHLMALIMGCLSDDPEDNIQAESQILFLKENRWGRALQTTDYDYLLEMVNAILYTKNAFKHDLKQNEQAYTDPIQVLKRWPLFSERLKSQKDNLTLPVHQQEETFYSAESYLGPLSSCEHERSQSYLFYGWYEGITDTAWKLEAGRELIVKDFFVKKTAERSSEFVHINTHSQAYKRLKEQPIAQALYNSFMQKLQVCYPEWLFKLKELQGLLETVKEKKETLEEKSHSLKQTLIKQANATPLEEGKGLTLQELQASLKRKIDVFSHQRQEIIVEEMALMLLERQWGKLRERNPFLSEEDSNRIGSQMLSLMFMKSEQEVYAKALEQIARLVTKIDKGERVDTAYCAQQVVEILDVKRHYNLFREPHFLAFEYLTHLILRKHQVDKIKQTLSFNPSHQVLKLMMGEGKTHVILPLLSKMLADGTFFPVIVAPASLYNEYLNNLKNTSSFYLSQLVFTLQFDRSSSTQLADLKTLEDKLEAVIKEKRILLTTAEALKALLLKYEELLVLEEGTSERSEELSSRRQHLGAILQKFRRSGVALIDEGHLALKSLTEMNFTLSTYETITKRQTQTILALYKALKKIDYDFSFPLQTDAAEEAFSQFEDIKTSLLFTLYPSEDEVSIRAYLRGQNPQFIYDLQQTNPSMAEEIALVKEELLSFLPFTLSKSLNHFYGRHRDNLDIECAIPYIGAQKPNPTSEFGHKYIVVNYTIQMLMQEGLTNKQFTKWLKKLKAEWLTKQVQVSQEAADDVIKHFFDDTSIREESVDDERTMEKWCQAYGKKDAIVFDYLETILLPSLKFYNEKLSANSQDLGDFLFPKVLVLTGTPYNEVALPAPFQQQECAVSEEEKKLFYSLSLPANRHIYTVDSESHEQALALIQECDRQNSHLAAFIDLGAYFKDVTSLEAAKMILGSLEKRIEGVLFFDDRSNRLMCLKKREEKAEPYIPGRIPLEKLFAFFDNIHTFGAHIDLPSQARALISLNQDTEKYALEQAIKRMRKLEENQTVSYVISSSLEKRLQALTFQKKLEVESLFLHAIFNQAKNLEKEIILSTTHQLKHVIKKQYLHQQLSQKEPLGLAKKVLVDTIDFSPSFHFKQAIQPIIFFLNDSRRFQASIPEIKVEEEKEKAIILKAAALLPDTINENDCGEHNREVQKQEEKKVEMESSHSNCFEPKVEEAWDLKCLMDIGSCAYPIANTFYMSNNKQLICYSLNDFLSHLEGKFLAWVQPSIFLTRNFAKTSELHLPNWEIPIKSVDYFLQLAYPHQLQNIISPYYLILSLQEADAFRDLFEKGTLRAFTNRPSITLFSIRGAYMAGDQIPLMNSSALMQMKFFDGREHLSQNEEKLAVDWVLGKEELLVDLFAKLHRNRDTQQDYGQGNLFKFMTQSKNVQRQRLLSQLQPSLGLKKRKFEETSWIFDNQKKEEGEGMQVDTEPAPPPFKKLKISKKD